jgi:glycosidase
MWGGADPDHEKPMLWKDLAFEPEATHPLGQPRKAEAIRFDDVLLKFFQGIGQLRAAQSALRRGSFETVLADDARQVFAFARVLETDRVIAAFNASDKEAILDLPAPAPTVRDLLTGRRLRARDEKVQVAVPGLGAVYLVADSR